MIKLSVNTLIEKLQSGLSSIKGVEYISLSNPVCFNFEGTIYHVYLRNLSHAGKSYPENSWRAQLPSNPAFDAIKNSSDRFLFLGYTDENDIFVCWDPVKAKNRLNHKSYVSFFSRKSVQDSASEGNIIRAELTNGDVFYAFKRVDLPSFLSMIELYYPELKDDIDTVDKTQIKSEKKPKVSEDIVGVLVKVEDDESIKLLVDSLLEEDKNSLSIISSCMNEFGTYYNRMSFRDWAKVINIYLQQ